MALLDILIYPDERLRQCARPVDRFDSALKKLALDMAETMYHANGIGLAAIQVNVPLRVVVIDLSEAQNHLQVFINPQIEPLDGVQEYQEGCLSVPGFFANVERAERVRIKAFDVEGQSFELEADGLLSVCIQHEVDHLDGRVFVDYLSRLKQNRVRKKLLKEHRRDKAA